MDVRLLLPPLGVVIALIVQLALPMAHKQPAPNAPYFTYFLLAMLAWRLAQILFSIKNDARREKLAFRGYFAFGVAIFLTALNLVTSKFALLPVLYFPSLDRIFGVIVEARALLGKCVLYSMRLLLTGYLGGALCGLITGTCVGFNKKVSYWLMPVVRTLGPIPSTAWIPLALIVFPAAAHASVFLIGLAVWFPTTIMTSSGIGNVPQSYFDAGSTLGAKGLAHVFRIGLPAAMPHIFLGLFNGTCASFITLITAEMIGAKYGIGWYVNWQKDMLSYANVYAGLIISATLFSILISLLFRLRDKALLWQKEVVKW